MSNKPAPSLKALAESKTDGVTKVTTYRVDPNLIVFEEGFNLRENTKEVEAHVERLYLAMKQGAFIPPVDIQMVDGVPVARDGHCRTRAARKLAEEMKDYPGIECRQLKGNDADAVLHMLGTGSGGLALSPLEQGKGYLRLISMGMTSQQIATKLGVSRVTVDNGVVLAEAPVKVQKLIVAGEVSSTVAREALKNGKEGVKALLDAAEAKRQEPAADKKGKPVAKKKVTAKTLRGTAAEKKPKKEKMSAALAEVELNNVDINTVIDPSLVTVTLNRDNADAAAKYLREFAGDAEDLKDVANAIEMALM